MNKLTKIISFALIFLAGALFVSCEKSVDRDFRSAMMEAQKSNWRTALSRLEGVMKVDPSSESGLKAAREAVRISFYEIKDYKRTLQYLRHLVLYSPNSEESVASQRQIINISFDQLQEYEQAIEEISRLLQIEKNQEARIELKLKLARSYFHLNNFFQASAEVADMLKKPEASKYEFELKLLKANILTATKSYQEAVVLLKEIMNKWPDQALRENVPMTLTVCYEEMKDFKSAIETLESIKASHPVPEFVELRLKRLKDRKMNQPGARGWRK